jgi:hypothetical protein
MKTPHYRLLIMIPVIAFGTNVARSSQPAAAYIPSQETSQSQGTSRTDRDEIEILTAPPATDAVILGRLSLNGNDATSLHDLIVTALNTAASKGADFVALSQKDAEHYWFLGKMVPVGHGRSMFVAGPVKGSEVNRIAAIPGSFPSSVEMVLGRYTR